MEIIDLLLQPLQLCPEVTKSTQQTQVNVKRYLKVTLPNVHAQLKPRSQGPCFMILIADGKCLVCATQDDL